MRIALSTYSLAQKQRTGELTLVDCIKKAKELGFDAIEIVPIDDSDPALFDLAAVQTALGETGLAVTNLTVSADFLKRGVEAETKRLQGFVDIAATLGAKGMRHDATWGSDDPFETVLPTLAEGCLAVTTYAATKGVRTMVENHGYFCQDPDRVIALAKAVGHENFGLLVDMGNFLCTDCDPLEAVNATAPFAAYLHAKDFKVLAGMDNPPKGTFPSRDGKLLEGVILGHGVVPVADCVAAAKAAGYQGDIGLEFEGSDDAYIAVAEGLSLLRGIV